MNDLVRALEEQTAVLKNIARDIQSMKSSLFQVINYMTDAESEIPERVRRFIMYYHDVHDILHLYDEQGSDRPSYVLRELERCHDRYRHILEDMEMFEKVRQDMTKRAGNRYDHSRLLGVSDETRTE